MDFDFAANRTVDAIDVVPQEFRGAYVEKDGGYHISDAYLPFVDLAVGLTGSLKASRNEAKSLKGRTVDLSPLAEFGATPAEIAAHFNTTVADLNDKLAKGVKIDPEKIKADLSRGFSDQLTAKDGQIASMGATLQKYLVQGEATRAIANAKGVPELLLPHIANQVKVVQNGDEYTVVVVDREGDARISGKTGQQMTIADLVEEMKVSTTFGRAFESDAGSGGGQRPQQQRVPAGGKSPAQQREGMTSMQKIAAGLGAMG